MKIHELKLDIKYFDDVKNGNKNFEIRKNDRDYQIGDILELKAWTEDTEKYHTHGKGSYLSWGTIEPAKPLFDFGQKPEAGLSDYFMVQNATQADTIKVRVTWMLDTFVNTNKWKAALKYLMDESNERADDTAEKISEVLEQYFHTNHLPDDYAVLGIEVVE